MTFEQGVRYIRVNCDHPQGCCDIGTVVTCVIHSRDGFFAHLVTDGGVLHVGDRCDYELYDEPVVPRQPNIEVPKYVDIKIARRV